MNGANAKLEALRRNAGVTAERAAAERARADARAAERLAWAARAIADLRARQARADYAWDRALRTLGDDPDPEALDALPAPPEQAPLDALHAEIDAVRTHDRWPRHLYWGGV